MPDPAFPFPQGQISTDDDRFVGFDVGDPSLQLPVTALPGRLFDDVMIYGLRQWPSAYTYEGIRARLLQEAGMTDPPVLVELLADAPGPAEVTADAPGLAEVTLDPPPAGWGSVHVVAVLNLQARTGQILYVNPTSAVAPAAASTEHGVELQVNDGEGRPMLRRLPHLLFIACEDPSAASQALLTEDLPLEPGTREVVLLIDGQVRSWHVSSPLDLDVAAGIVVSDPLPGRPNRRALTGRSRARHPGVTYTVQARPGPDSHWQTVAVGRATPDTEVDVNQFPSAERVEVRVLMTNGFEERALATEEITVGDLDR